MTEGATRSRVVPSCLAAVRGHYIFCVTENVICVAGVNNLSQHCGHSEFTERERNRKNMVFD